MGRKKYFLPVVFIALAVLISVGGYEYYENVYLEKPEESVTKAFDSIQSGDGYEAERYLDYSAITDKVGSKDIFNAVIRDFGYEINECETDGDKGKAVLQVQNRDFSILYGNYVIDAYSYVLQHSDMNEDDMKEKLDSIFVDEMENGKASTVISLITVELNRKGRVWTVSLDDSDIDSILGGYVTAQEDAQELLADSGSSLESVEEAYQQQIDDAGNMLKNAAHFIVDDLWNGELCNVISCINAGTDTDGNEYDLEQGMENVDSLMEDKLAQYDTQINDLDSNKYKDIIDAWNIYKSELNYLVEDIKENDPNPKDYYYHPDTAGFESAMNNFVNLVYNEESSQDGSGDTQ